MLTADLTRVTLSAQLVIAKKNSNIKIREVFRGHFVRKYIDPYGVPNVFEFYMRLLQLTRTYLQFVTKW